MAASIRSWLWRVTVPIPAVLSSVVFGVVFAVLFYIPLTAFLMRDVHIEPVTFIAGVACGFVIWGVGGVLGYAIGIMTMSRGLSKETMFALVSWKPEKRLLDFIYRHQSLRFHNGVMVVGCTLLFLAFFVASLWIAKNLGEHEWVRAAHSPYVYAAFGFGIYFLLVGHPWTRVMLVAAVPFVVRVIISLLGHVPAGDVANAFVYGAYDVVVFAVGAAIASVFTWLFARKEASPAA
jgi:hypothetical protein